MRNKPELTSNSGKFNLRYIYGMKLRNLNKKKDLALNNLSHWLGYLIHIINEIEKGKKYPKAEK